MNFAETCQRSDGEGGFLDCLAPKDGFELLLRQIKKSTGMTNGLHLEEANPYAPL
jgi:hypothetical protein